MTIQANVSCSLSSLSVLASFLAINRTCRWSGTLLGGAGILNIFGLEGCLTLEPLFLFNSFTNHLAPCFLFNSKHILKEQALFLRPHCSHEVELHLGLTFSLQEPFQVSRFASLRKHSVHPKVWKEVRKNEKKAEYIGKYIGSSNINQKLAHAF